MSGRTMPATIVFTFVMLVAAMLLATPVAAANQYRGTIKSVEDGKLTLIVTATADQEGQEITFSVTEDCKITLDGEEAKETDLKKGQSCTVTAEKDDQGALVAKGIAARSAQ